MTWPARYAVAASLLLAAVPSAAVAQTGHGQSVMRFAFASHSGYRVRVLATQSTIELRAARRAKSRDSETATAYFARAKLGGDRVKASFGDLGRVSMRFVRGAGAPSARCAQGRRLRIRPGRFVGLLRFSGEGDYLDVHVRRAGGTSISESGARCRAAAGPRRRRTLARRPQKPTFLDASFRTGLDALYFQAFKPGSGRAVYSVEDEAGGGHVAILRRAYAKASPLTFATDEALSFASVSPPYPFGGTGTIQRRANGSRSWSGSLTVSFPGEPNQPLTGPRFKTQLVRQW